MEKVNKYTVETIHGHTVRFGKTDLGNVCGWTVAQPWMMFELPTHAEARQRIEAALDFYETGRRANGFDREASTP